MKENRTFSDDIERAEKALLWFSWLGVISALTIMGYTFWSLVQNKREPIMVGKHAVFNGWTVTKHLSSLICWRL